MVLERELENLRSLDHVAGGKKLKGNVGQQTAVPNDQRKKGWPAREHVLKRTEPLERDDQVGSNPEVARTELERALIALQREPEPVPGGEGFAELPVRLRKVRSESQR